MSKLWIVHRHARHRAALAGLAGLAADELVVGAPSDEIFTNATPPTALVIGLAGDFELELDFLHRHRRALAGAARRLQVEPEDADEALRLVGASPEELLVGRTDARTLRAFVIGATAHRPAESLAARGERERIAARFGSWFGDLEIPGLLRALDPTLSALPLLVRGPPGSGRALVARYLELFRGRATAGPRLRIDARDLTGDTDLVERLAARLARDLVPAESVWIDEVDTLAPSAQRALAEWIRLDVSPTASVASGVRWVATAGPGGLRDRLDDALALALSPLAVEVPGIAERQGELERFAEREAADWSERFGGTPRTLAPDVIDALEARAWMGDRAAVEAALQTAFAATSRNPITAMDLGGGLSLGLAPDGADAALGTAPAGSRAAWSDPMPTPGDFAEAPVIPPPATAASEAPPAPRDAPDPPEPVIFEGIGETPASTPADNTNNAGQAAWRRLARSLTHEIRNPLVSIRTFAELLPENFDDASFRERFTELVRRDVAHIDELIGRLADASAQEKTEATPVDVSALLERLLNDRREAIGERRLLVLRELERDQPIAWADAPSLEASLEGLLDRALAALPERGDLFVATRRIDRGSDGKPRLRILLRHRGTELGTADMSGLTDVSTASNVLEYVLAETVVEAVGGRMTIDTTDSEETLILIDLPTPA